MTEPIREYFSLLIQSLYERITGNEDAENDLLDKLDKLYYNFSQDECDIVKMIVMELKEKEQTIEMRKKVIEKNYGLDSSYKVICDETNNTLEDAENGVVNVDIIITHPKTIDKLPLNLQ